MSKFYKQNVTFLVINKANIFFGHFVAIVDPIYFTQGRFTLCCVFDPILFYPIKFDAMAFDATSLGRLTKGFRVKCENLSDIFRNFR